MRLRTSAQCDARNASGATELRWAACRALLYFFFHSFQMLQVPLSGSPGDDECEFGSHASPGTSVPTPSPPSSPPHDRGSPSAAEVSHASLTARSGPGATATKVGHRANVRVHLAGSLLRRAIAHRSASSSTSGLVPSFGHIDMGRLTPATHFLRWRLVTGGPTLRTQATDASTAQLSNTKSR